MLELLRRRQGGPGGEACALCKAGPGQAPASAVCGGISGRDMPSQPGAAKALAPRPFVFEAIFNEVLGVGAIASSLEYIVSSFHGEAGGCSGISSAGAAKAAGRPVGFGQHLLTT